MFICRALQPYTLLQVAYDNDTGYTDKAEEMQELLLEYGLDITSWPTRM